MWARLGVTIDLTPLHFETPEDYIMRALETGNVYLDGETYFPDCPDNPKMVGDVEAQMDKTPLALEK